MSHFEENLKENLKEFCFRPLFEWSVLTRTALEVTQLFQLFEHLGDNLRP